MDMSYVESNQKLLLGLKKITLSWNTTQQQIRGTFWKGQMGGRERDCAFLRSRAFFQKKDAGSVQPAVLQNVVIPVYCPDCGHGKKSILYNFCSTCSVQLVNWRLIRDLQGKHALLPVGGLKLLNALQKLVCFSRPKEISIYFIFRLSSVPGS